MKTILHIIGNRPQIIKLAVLYNQLATDKNINQKIIHTGQHFSFDMSDIFFAELQLPQPDINFNIQNSSPFLFIGEAANALQQYFLQQNNAFVFVYGDTNTTLAAALAAKRTGLPLLHFEAGVRTYDNSMPEEINRVITDRLSDVNYCCTQQNFLTLQKEGYEKNIASNIVLTGDLMLDAFFKIEASTKIICTHQQYIVCTIHREANLQNSLNLKNIIGALNKINATIPVVMPLHPHTKKKLAQYNIEPCFTILNPLGYRDMKNLLSQATYVITDSGGFSREAYFLQKKSLIIMDTPFWPEIIEAHCSLSTSANENLILQKFDELKYLNSSFTGNIFGDGHAAKKIHQHLISYIVLHLS